MGPKLASKRQISIELPLSNSMYHAINMPDKQVNNLMRAVLLIGTLIIADMAAGQTPAAVPKTAADPVKGQQLASQVCAACHGADGNSTIPDNPKLAAQHSSYVHKQLRDFKGNSRKSAIMTPLASSLSEDDMRNLGAYYSTQTLKPGAAKDKTLALQGQKIYRAGNAATGLPACAACHLPNGAGIPVQFPSLGGQNTNYVIAQLQKFRNGERTNDANRTMQTIASKMTDQEITAVAEYIAGLH